MLSAICPAAAVSPALRADFGGPMHADGTRRLDPSLGRDNVIRPRVIRLGLLFEDAIDQVAEIESLLLMERIEGAEDLRERFQAPPVA